VTAGATTSVEIARPHTIAEAVELLARHGETARVVAGSTAVSILLRQRLIDPAVLVALRDVPGLDGIDVRDGRVEMGALVTHRSVERDRAVRAALPVLAEVFGRVANPRIRNAATVGGVVAEADYASDPPAVLRGLDAVVVARGPDGEREIPCRDFFRAFYETALGPAEIVTSVRVPLPASGTVAVYEKFVSRSSEDRPCVGVFAACRPGSSGAFEDVRVAVGAAAETPQRFEDLEAQASGTDIGDDVVRVLADGYAERIETLDDVRGSAWYRTEMVRVWVRRALARARDGEAAQPAARPS
jgi:carbon-monoxide dehydrogenase medium subunit